MPLLQDVVVVKITPYNFNHYKKLGYDVKKKSGEIIANVNDLSDGSGIKVLVKCDHCGKEFYKSWRRYLESKDDICCVGCRKEKIIKKSIEKYGYSCSLKNEAVSKKRFETNMKLYGVDMPLKNKDIYRKTRESFYNNTRNVCDSIRSSRQQTHIMNLYNAEINKLFDIYFVDGYIDEYKMYIEYDGSGHKLQVKMGEITEDEYNRKEKERTKRLLSCGIKEFRIVCNDDILPDDKKLIEIKDIAIKKLSEGYSICIYNTSNDSWDFIEE